MLEDFEFAGGQAKYNGTINGAPISWAWAENGRGPRAAYKAYHDKKHKKRFFAVIWQVNLPKSDEVDKSIRKCQVRLQVESPGKKADGDLNNLKWDVVRKIGNSNVKQAVLARFGYDTKYLKTSEEDVRQNRTTTVFRVVLDDEQANLTPEAKIELVHKALGRSIDEIVKRFTSQLEDLFQPG